VSAKVSAEAESTDEMTEAAEPAGDVVEAIEAQQLSGA
jgi:hypothetical protein